MTHEEMVDDLRTTLITGLKLEDVDPADLLPDTVLFGDGPGLGLDSLDAVELSVVLEKRYGVSFRDAEDVRGAFSSLGNLAAAVLQLQGDKQA